MVVYYDENEESAVDIVLDGVEQGHFTDEETYSPQEFKELEGLIYDALPLLEEATYLFAQAVYDAFKGFDDHPSFSDELTAEYLRLSKSLRYEGLEHSFSYFLSTDSS